MVSLQSCGWCCSIFSVFAIFFLCIVAAVINSESEVILLNTEKTPRASAVKALLGAAAIYTAFFLISIGCIIYRPKTITEADVRGVSAPRVVEREN